MTQRAPWLAVLLVLGALVGLVTVPESFIINRTGVVVQRQIGAYERDRPSVNALVRRPLPVRDPR